jgi:glycosyltransferase involved in cell wall biosynthesis
MQDPHRRVGQSPGFPGADDEHSHGADDTGVTVVVCSRNRAEMLARALPAVRSAMRSVDELIVVDSASTDANVAVIAADLADSVVRTALPGLGRARNAGWTRARRGIVAFTDDDCTPQPGWTAALADALGDERGFVFGTVQAVGSGVPLSVTTEQTERTYDRGDLQRPTSFGHGANFACRVDALRGVGGFDDELGTGGRFHAGEDTDIAVRMLAAGWPGAFDPRPVVQHELWRSRRQALRVVFNYGIGSGACAVKARALGVNAPLLRRELVDRGIAQAGRDLRNRYEFGVAVSLVRTAGVAVGGWQARRLPVVDGRFRP